MSALATTSEPIAFARVARALRIGSEGPPWFENGIPERVVFERTAQATGCNGLTLHRCPTVSSWFRELGRYYLADAAWNIVATHVDLEALAREHGVMKARQVIA